MNIVFISRTHGQSLTYSMNGKRLLVSLLFLILALSGITYAGFYYAKSQQSDVLTPDMISRWSQELSDQKEEVVAQRMISSQKIDALSVKMGELQARLLRLEGLGERLTQMAEIDTNEFDFASGPGMGGPSDMLDEYYQAPTLKLSLIHI